MLQKLYSLMLRHMFKPNPKYDQNFIINKKIIQKVIELIEPKNTDVILEIGPGVGFLTNELVKTSKVIAIEKDKKMVDILNKEIPPKNLQLINEDFLKVDLNKLKFNKVVGFIPYSLSQQIIYKLENKYKTILIVQKEFAEKLSSIEGFENYNAISVIMQTYFEIKIIQKMGRNSFYPAPKCESAIIELTPKNTEFNEDYNNFVKEIFRYSNKDLFRALKLSQDIKIDKEKIENLDDDFKKIKVKQLSIEEIKEIYDKLF